MTRRRAESHRGNRCFRGNRVDRSAAVAAGWHVMVANCQPDTHGGGRPPATPRRSGSSSAPATPPSSGSPIARSTTWSTSWRNLTSTQNGTSGRHGRHRGVGDQAVDSQGGGRPAQRRGAGRRDAPGDGRPWGVRRVAAGRRRLRQRGRRHVAAASTIRTPSDLVGSGSGIDRDRLGRSKPAT